MTARALVARGALWLPALGCLLVAIFLFDAGTSETALRCARAKGTCTWRRASMVSGSERVFRIDDVREVRFVEGLGKHGRDAETTLVFASGRELGLARGPRETARYRFTAMHGFFAPGATDPWLRDVDAASHGLLLAALALGIAAGVLGVRAWRTTPSLPDPVIAQPGEPTWWQRRRRTVLLALGALAIITAGQLALMLIASYTQGTLTLDCQGRCRFQGAECLPGGEVRMTLDPGTYTIDVWTGAPGAPWIPRTFAIRVGETTDFVCAP